MTHPLAVAGILVEMHMDHQSLMAAMLHDVIEDTGITKTAIKNQFGNTVADLVDGVSKLNKITFSSRAEAQAENFQKMAMAMAKDLRVILVKIADRLHNMRTLEVLTPDKRRRIARETLDIYAPIATRLGMNNVRIEFEDLGFAALYPMRAQRIDAAVRHIRGNRKEIVSQIQTSLEACLEREGLPGRTIGREKHLYSIYEKMRIKRKSFSDIMDVYAFRIIVDSVDTCYRVLGAVHNLYKPVPADSRTTSPYPKRTAISHCTPRCSACMACRSKFRYVLKKWRRWRTTALLLTGFTNPATICPPMPISERESGLADYWRCRSTRVIRWNSSSTSKLTCFQTKSMYSHPKAASLNCRQAPLP